MLFNYGGNIAVKLVKMVFKKTYVVLIAVVLLLEKCYDKKLPGRPLTMFTLCVLWTSAGQQKKVLYCINFLEELFSRLSIQD